MCENVIFITECHETQNLRDVVEVTHVGIFLFRQKLTELPCNEYTL